jgi:hypothetical protein
MAVRLTHDGRALEVHASGTLVHEDYQQIVPEFERVLGRHGRVNLLFELVDFHGWKPRAAWDDFKLAVKHYSDIGRMAVVGDKKWEKGMALVCRPLTGASVRYFDRAAINEARVWLEGG